MPRPLPYRKVIRALSDYDPRFEVWINRGKGSERIIYHPDIAGRPESYPIKCHGEGTEIRPGTLSAIIRRFRLPRDIFDR
jgi:hypothetical protein